MSKHTSFFSNYYQYKKNAFIHKKFMTDCQVVSVLGEKRKKERNVHNDFFSNQNNLSRYVCHNTVVKCKSIKEKK